MIFNFRTLVLLLAMFACVSCNDSLDEVLQDFDKTIPERFVKSIRIVDDGSLQTYEFNYNDDYKLISFTDSKSKLIALEHDEDDDKLTNFDIVGNHIFYSDIIFKNPYELDYDNVEIELKKRNGIIGNPIALKMVLTPKVGSIKYIDVEITYDNAPNTYKPYLEAGGVLDAAAEVVSLKGRGQYFTQEFLPTNNPTSIVFRNSENEIEHVYSVLSKYDYMKRVTMCEVTHLDHTTGSPLIPKTQWVYFEYLKVDSKNPKTQGSL